MPKAPNMMQALATLIKGSTELKAIVGEDVFQYQLPENQKAPAIVLFNSSGIAEDTLSGQPIYVDTATVQVDCHGRTRGEAQDISALVRDHIAGYRGVVANVHIKSIFQSSGPRDLGDRPALGGDLFRPIRSQDFGIVYQSQSEV